MLNKIWNSKAMDIIGEVGYETSKAVVGMIGCLGECLCDIFSHGDDHISYGAEDEITYNEKELGDETYEYWYYLTSSEREDYFKNNLVIQDKYGDMWYYEDRYQMAKHMKEIAQKEGREFTNKYDRY